MCFLICSYPNSVSRFLWLNHTFYTLRIYSFFLNFRLAGGQQRVSGHVSLKETAHLRGQSGTPPFISNITKESKNSNLLPFHQRSSSDNIANYLPYSPYALRRKEITRPFSSQITKDNSDPNLLRPFSPYKNSFDYTRDFVSSRNSASGQSKQDGKLYSRKDLNCADTGNRSYSPYHSRFDPWENSKDRWKTAPRSISAFTRDYSPWRRENVDPPGVIPPVRGNGRYSSFIQNRLEQLSTVPQTYPKTQDVYGSPISRKRY